MHSADSVDMRKPFLGLYCESTDMHIKQLWGDRDKAAILVCIVAIHWNRPVEWKHVIVR